VKVPVIRELAGVHEYDGVVMDLSPSGRKAALERLGPSSPGERLADRHDERHLSAAERAARAEAEAEVLRWNPLPHIQNLDLSCYDREYAPEP
jgi:dipeptidyl aminopeptidase/acylaminoacyl peptidase